MKKISLYLFFVLVFSPFIPLNASEIKLEKIVGDLDKPWSLSFINQDNVIFTEKSGKLFTFNLIKKKKLKLNIPFPF